ncbi:MAG: PAS domain S-box protein [Bacteroidota bacterium]|nr:PAS domain S-box protein [Bacteroidota bacterium]
MKDKFKILHVEDVVSDAELVARTLKRQHFLFDFLVIDTEEEFVYALDNFFPDVILCDHSLPAFNSFGALKIIKDRRLNIPFIVITATMSEEVAMNVVREGAEDYVLKDRLNRLPFVVANAIDKYRFEKDRKKLIDDAYQNEAGIKSELKKLSDKLLLVTKAAGIGTWEFDPYKQQFTNDDILFDIYGLDPAKFNGSIEMWSSFIHPQDKEYVLYEFQQALINKPTLEISFRIIRADSEIRFIKAITIAQEGDDGKVVRLVGTNQDVTASKITEFEIRESEEKYRSFFENSLDGILITATNGKVISANPAACDMFQMTEAEICHVGRFGLMDTFDNLMTEVVAGRRNIQKAKGELTFIRKDGTWFPGEITSSKYFRANGEERTSMIIRDITERKEAEAAILESEAFSRGVLDSLNSHIAVINKSGTILKVNRPWIEFALNNGGSQNNVYCEGANYFTVLHNRTDLQENSRQSDLERIQQVLNGQSEEYYLEYPCHSPAEQRWFYMRVRKFEGSEPLAVVEHFNISERKKAEESLDTTSHELKKALTELEKIMHSSLDIICSIDEEGRFVNVSSAAKSIWGYEPDELAGARYMEFVFFADKEHTSKVAARIISGVPVTMFENRYVRKDGSVVPMLWSAKWDNEAKMMFCIAKDATEKKKMEAAFNSEQQRLQELFTHAPASVGVFKGRDHVFEMANDQYLQLSGRKDIIGKTVREVFPEVENQGLFELLDQVFTTGIPFTSNERLIQVDKKAEGQLEDIYLNFVYHPYRNNENVIEGVFFFAVDVTEQVEARKKVEESEKRFRQLIEDLPEAVYTCNAEGKIELYNNAAVKLWGRKPVIGKDYWSGSHKAYYINGAPIVPEEGPMALAIKTGKAHFEFEVIIEHPNGEKRFARANPIPLFNKAQKLVGAVNMLVDITDLKLIEEKLRTSNERYQIVTKATNDGIWDWNLSTNEIYWNKSYERMFGYKNLNQKLDADSWFDKIHAEDRERVKTGVLNIINNGGSLWEDEYRYLTADGGVAIVYDRGYLMYDEGGKPTRFVGAMEDISQRKKIENEREYLIEHLVKSNNDLKQFTYITSHNFRAPLSNLIGLLSLIDQSTLSEANKEILNMFEISTQQLNKTINDLIQILIIKNNINVNIVNNNINDVLNDVCNSLSYEIAEVDCTINRNIGVENIVLNKSYLESILINLLSNSIKYRSPNRKLVIDILTEKKANGEILIMIKDNGSGIDMKRHKDQIFGLYQRFHGNKEGVGLGLYMVKTQIMALGGKIEVQSSEDVGTEFLITFK